MIKNSVLDFYQSLLIKLSDYKCVKSHRSYCYSFSLFEIQDLLFKQSNIKLPPFIRTDLVETESPSIMFHDNDPQNKVMKQKDLIRQQLFGFKFKQVRFV